MRDVFLLAGARTPIGARSRSLAAVDGEKLAAAVLRGALERAPQGGTPQRVILGTALGRGNGARYASLAAGLPPGVPAFTVNAQCTSGLTAVRLAFEAIAAGAAEVVLAGGFESTSRAEVDLGGRPGAFAGASRVAHAPPPFADPDMGPAADAVAEHLGIPREAQDELALASYRRAVHARESGFFAPLVVPVGDAREDDLPRRLPAPDRLRRYPPAFDDGGTVTVGNAAPFADGAAALVLSSQPGASPCFRIRATASAAADSSLPALAVVPAVEAALAAAGLEAGSVDRWEVNEAFAVKVVALVRHFGISLDRVNPNGGAIATGHPFGASGAILLLHLLQELRRSGGRYGVAAIAGAGGLGESVVLERV